VEVTASGNNWVAVSMGARGKKGITMSMDAIVAATLMLSLISVLGAVRYSSSQPQNDFEPFYYNSRDVVIIMQTAKLTDIRDFPVIQNLTASGDLVEADMNKSVLDIIGAYWAAGNASIARNITQTFLEGFLPSNFGFDVLIDGGSIYNNSRQMGNFVSRTSFLVSGFKKEAAVEGYVSSAWLTKATANDTILVSISPSGGGYSGAGLNRGNFTFVKTFELPANATNISAIIYMSVHEGDSGVNRNVTVFINGIQQFSILTSGGSYFVQTVYNITPGNNSIRIKLDKPNSYNAHFHPGLSLMINYQAEKDLFYEEPLENLKRIYFSYAEGTPAVYETLPFILPEGSRINNATLHLYGQQVDDNAEIEVNNYTAWSSSNPPYNPSINLTITSYLKKNGNLSTGETNLVGVYFDTKASDTDYLYANAKNQTRILNTSYLELNYTNSRRTVKYGFLPVAMLVNANKTILTDGKQANWTLPATDFIDPYLHPVEQLSWELEVAAWHEPEPPPTWSGSAWSNYTVFSSPTSRNVPSDIYIPPSRLKANATNLVNAKDTSGNVLTNTTLSYTIFAPVQVGYGSVFNNQTAAVNDAAARLNAVLNQYRVTVNLQDIQYSTQATSKVPWMWGPAVLEVRIWT